MIIRTPAADRLDENEITDQSVFRQRRRLVAALGLAPVSAWTGAPALACEALAPSQTPAETPNSYHQITRYNNYFEFSTNKEAVALLAGKMPLRPWTVEVAGEVEKPLLMDVDSLIASQQTVERIYPLRCVEGWSMVIPWNGFPLCELLRRARPTSRARYVEFVSHVDPEHMIGLRRTALQFPYREALRIDEAMHPLTLLATGIYGRDIPAQNGAPLRLVVPWKYGFKSAKAIVRILLRANRPATSWNLLSPTEYGFLANVNPAVAHPRWSQRREVRIGEMKKRKTLPFNGYADQVAHLYRDLDLRLHY